MKKMINNPDNVIEELMSGYLIAYPEYIRRSELHKRALIGKKRNTYTGSYKRNKSRPWRTLYLWKLRRRFNEF